MLRKNHFLFCPAVLLLLFAAHLASFLTTAHAQDSSFWEEAGLYGGQVLAIAVDPEDNATVYAGSYSGDGLFKSTDRGATWRTIPGFRNMGILDIDIDPNNPENVWVCFRQYVAFSVDYGETWQYLDFAYHKGMRTCFAVAVDPHDATGSTVYVGTSGRGGANSYGAVFKTTDGGASWDMVQRFADYNILDIMVNPNTADEVWAVSAPWALAVNSGRIYMSTNGGRTWYDWSSAAATDGYAYPMGYLDNVLVHPVDPLKIFAAGHYGVLTKPDGTQRTSWHISELPEEIFMSHAISIPFAEPDMLYASLIAESDNSSVPDYYIAQSSDYGLSWDAFWDAPYEMPVLTPDPFNPAQIYAGTVHQGIFKTEDSARSWSAISINDSVLAPDNPEVLLCSTTAGLFLGRAGQKWQS
ncbi:hypothetical protein ACFL43_05475, partial [Thermodesulfobacteriota bacterium]